MPAEPGGDLHRAPARQRRPEGLRADDDDALPILLQCGGQSGDDGPPAHPLHAEKVRHTSVVLDIIDRLIDICSSQASNLLASLQGAQVSPSPRAAAALHLTALILGGVVEDGRRPHAKGRREPRSRDAAGE